MIRSFGWVRLPEYPFSIPTFLQFFSFSGFWLRYQVQIIVGHFLILQLAMLQAGGVGVVFFFVEEADNIDDCCWPATQLSIVPRQRPC